MPRNKLQGENDMNSGEGEKGTNYTRMPHEYLDFLIDKKRVQLTALQIIIYLKLVRELHGWTCKEKALSQSKLADEIGVPFKKFNAALQDLISAGIVKKRKIKGQRMHMFTFNEKLFGRVLCVEEPKEMDLKELNIPKKGIIASIPEKGITSIPNMGILTIPEKGIRESRKITKLKGNSVSKERKDIIKDISLSKFLEFLKDQPPVVRPRWERVISDILKKNPSDDLLLSVAISMVHKNRKDFQGSPIKRSIIGLFESLDWSLVRDTVLMNYRKEKEREELKKTVEMSNKQKEEQVVNVTELAPYWQKYANKGNTEK